MELNVELPDALANEAKAAGLLAPDAIAKLLREAIARRKQFDAFFATCERLRAAEIPQMTEDEIQAEINAYRAEQREKRDRDRADRS